MDQEARASLNRNMTALADGDRKAFDPVYRILWPLLTGFVGRMCGDRVIAEDIAQQSMLKIFSRASTFDRSRDALAWSLTIAGNEYRTYRRKLGNRRMEALDLAVSLPANDETPETIVIRDNLNAAIRGVMGQIRPQDVDAVIAAVNEGERPPVTAAAFRKRLQRAIENSRLLWRRRYGAD